ncbi:hypothetical protein [Dyadobacter sp. CY261]|nr:hypothetical protein [Dyadobacter sp. CY261]
MIPQTDFQFFLIWIQKNPELACVLLCLIYAGLLAIIGILRKK